MCYNIIMKKERRTEVIVTRVTPSEKLSLALSAVKGSMKLSAYMRKKLELDKNDHNNIGEDSIKEE